MLAAINSQSLRILSVGLALSHSRADVGNGIRYERAWVCRNGGCDYSGIVGEA